MPSFTSVAVFLRLCRWRLFAAGLGFLFGFLFAGSAADSSMRLLPSWPLGTSIRFLSFTLSATSRVALRCVWVRLPNSRFCGFSSASYESSCGPPFPHTSGVGPFPLPWHRHLICSFGLWFSLQFASSSSSLRLLSGNAVVRVGQAFRAACLLHIIRHIDHSDHLHCQPFPWVLCAWFCGAFLCARQALPLPTPLPFLNRLLDFCYLLCSRMGSSLVVILRHVCLCVVCACVVICC